MRGGGVALELDSVRLERSGWGPAAGWPSTPWCSWEILLSHQAPAASTGQVQLCAAGKQATQRAGPGFPAHRLHALRNLHQCILKQSLGTKMKVTGRQKTGGVFFRSIFPYHSEGAPHPLDTQKNVCRQHKWINQYIIKLTKNPHDYSGEVHPRDRQTGLPLRVLRVCLSLSLPVTDYVSLSLI